MATSVPANYYNSKPIDPAHFNHYIVNTIDALLENALKVEHGSATLKFLYKIFGPVDVATVEPQAPTTQDSTDSNRKVSGLAVTALYIGSLPRG